MNYQFLTTTNLFRGMSAVEAESILSCLNANEKQYKKGEIIYYNGESIENIGLVMSGSVNILIDDLWGNSAILGRSETGQLFGETYACIPGEPLMVNVTACENCDILFLNISRLMTTCKNACPFHNRLIYNLLQIIALKNLALSLRSIHTSSKSLRGRLSSYLSEQAKRNGSYQFTIPFNRQQLAEYLGVDRSAMSNELSKMRREGILNYEKNHFSLTLSLDDKYS